MKSQPLSYNKDNQEDKQPLFDTIDTVQDCLRVYADMIPNLRPKRDNMRLSAALGFPVATDLADYLVRKGLSFRDSHTVVGKSVAYAIVKEKDLSQMSITELKKFSPLIEHDVYEILTLKGSVESRNHYGGTAPIQVKKAAQMAFDMLEKRS